MGVEYMWVETEKIDEILSAENSESRTEKEGERNLVFECLPYGSIYTQEQGDNDHRIRVQSGNTPRRGSGCSRDGTEWIISKVAQTGRCAIIISLTSFIKSQSSPSSSISSHRRAEESTTSIPRKWSSVSHRLGVSS